MELTHLAWRELPSSPHVTFIAREMSSKQRNSHPPVTVAATAVILAKPRFSVDTFQRPVKVNRSTAYSIVERRQIVRLFYMVLCICLNVFEELKN